MYVFFSLYITFKKGAIHRRSLCHQKSVLLSISKAQKIYAYELKNLGTVIHSSLMVTILLNNFITCGVLSSACWRLHRV